MNGKNAWFFVIAFIVVLLLENFIANLFFSGMHRGCKNGNKGSKYCKAHWKKWQRLLLLMFWDKETTYITYKVIFVLYYFYVLLTAAISTILFAGFNSFIIEKCIIICCVYILWMLIYTVDIPRKYHNGTLDQVFDLG